MLFVYYFKRTYISDDVHGKTVVTLMGGMESIASTKMHRNKAQKLFSHYDEKYIQKWVLHDEAVDLMVLKVQKIAMEDHYAKLYGPRIIAHKTIDSANTDDASTIVIEEDTSVDPMSQKANHDILLKAFSAHPYEAYKKKIGRMDSDSQENIQQLLKEEEKKASIIWKKAFSKSRVPSMAEKSSSIEENTDPAKRQNEKLGDIKTIFQIYSQVRDQSNVLDKGDVD